MAHACASIARRFARKPCCQPGARSRDLLGVHRACICSDRLERMTARSARWWTVATAYATASALAVTALSAPIVSAHSSSRAPRCSSAPLPAHKPGRRLADLAAALTAVAAARGPSAGPCATLTHLVRCATALYPLYLPSWWRVSPLARACDGLCCVAAAGALQRAALASAVPRPAGRVASGALRADAVSPAVLGPRAREDIPTAGMAELRVSCVSAHSGLRWLRQRQAPGDTCLCGVCGGWSCRAVPAVQRAGGGRRVVHVPSTCCLASERGF